MTSQYATDIESNRYYFSWLAHLYRLAGAVLAETARWRCWWEWK